MTLLAQYARQMYSTAFCKDIPATISPSCPLSFKACDSGINSGLQAVTKIRVLY